MSENIANNEIAKNYKMTKYEKKVLFATTIGSMLEWYDFFLFGLIANVMAKNFFSGVPSNIAFVFSLAIFAMGFVSRPFGAVIFGHLGDKIGRKYTFILTVMIMGIATIAIGLLPTAQQIGIYAPILLVVIRILQGLAMGGEIGGAVVYVAEHAPAHRRGEYTSWILGIGSIGVFLALIVIIATRTILRDNSVDVALRDARFEEWGWRVPFLFSSVILAVSIAIRLKLNESPMFLRMKEMGKLSASPLRETMGQWKNAKYTVIGLFGLLIPMAISLITGQFYALQFITQTLKLDQMTANILLATAIFLGMPFYIISGMISDRIGRKWIILGGTLVAIASFFPLFRALTHYINPDLDYAIKNAPITLTVDKNECHSQFDPFKMKAITTSCDIAVYSLAMANVPYHYKYTTPGSLAKITIGSNEIFSYRMVSESEMPRTAKAINAANKSLFEDQLAAALKSANYGSQADPAKEHIYMVFLIMLAMTIMGNFVSGALPACLVELFPTQIRYTGFSIPFHIGACLINGFFPAAAFAIVAMTGNIFDGLWIPVILGLSCVAFGAIFIPESHQTRVSLDD